MPSSESAFHRRGVQGSEARSALIPVDAITQLDQARILIEQTRGRVLDSPAPDLENPAPSEEYWLRLYDHYGYSLHWAEGTVFPGYPSA